MEVLGDVDARLKYAFDASLLDVIAHRRTRRFGLGYEIPSGALKYKSEKEPIPLDETETALLCWAGHGVNGIVLVDYPTDLSAISTMGLVGKAHPSPCNDVEHVALIYTNDDGVFVYQPKEAKRVVEIDTQDDWKNVLTSFQDNTKKIGDGRADIPGQALLRGNVWAANQPGSTCFSPVVDMTAEYINYCLLTFEGPGIQVVDTDTGEPAGVKKWVDNGFLRGPKVTLLEQDSHVQRSTTAQAHYMAQNISFTAEALGLGFFVFGGFSAPAVMGATPFGRGLGFRFVAGKNGAPNAVGIDGLIEGHCPPYFATMHDAVRDVVDCRFQPGAVLTPQYAGVTAQLDWAAYLEGVTGFKDETIECVTAFCEYVYDRYGRFPAYFDSVTVPMWLQVHHLDTDFYDKFYVPEALTAQQREHLKRWHGL